MCPSEFLLEVIELVCLVSSFGGFFEACSGLVAYSFQVWDSRLFLVQNLASLLDVFKTGVVFFTQLAELRAAKEELQETRQNKRMDSRKVLTWYLSVGADALRNCL